MPEEGKQRKKEYMKEDVEIEKQKFYSFKNIILMEHVNIDKIVLFEEFP